MKLAKSFVRRAVRVVKPSQTEQSLLSVVGEIAKAAYGIEPKSCRHALTEGAPLGATETKHSLEANPERGPLLRYMGDGIAIMSGRARKLRSPRAMLMKLEHALKGRSPDGKPIEWVVALLGNRSATGEDLKLLALFVRTLNDAAIRRKLDRTTDPDILHAILTGDGSVS